MRISHLGGSPVRKNWSSMESKASAKPALLRRRQTLCLSIPKAEQHTWMFAAFKSPHPGRS